MESQCVCSDTTTNKFINKIETLFDGLSQSNVLNTLTWDASRYSSGDYFIHLVSDEFSKTNKITLMK